MQISGSTSTYGTDQAQRLLSMLFQNQGAAGGQDVPGEASGDAGAATPTPPAPDAQKLASQTLSGLLAAQQSPPTASDLAQQMISQLDTDGDGSLSADEITKALGSTSQLSSDQVASAVSQLDTNGDGKLSADELTAGLQAAQPHGGGGHHHHGHADGASSSDLASALMSSSDTNGDGVLSADEVAKALGLDPSTTATATSGTDAASSSTSTSGTSSDTFSQLFASLDTNGDGSLSTSELTTAIDAFRTAHHHAEAGPASQTEPQTSVTA
jgi:Ca2+-binding EF-hand superfamily protein